MTESISKIFSDNLEIVSAARSRFTIHFITAHAEKNANMYSMFKDVADFVKEHDAQIITQFVFGGCEFHREGIPEIERNSGKIEWPVTWMQGDGCSGVDLSGTQLCAVSGINVSPIDVEGEVIGTYFEDDNAEYCFLGDARPTDISVPREEQARATFDKMCRGLQSVGMAFSQVVRTWLYLDRLLEWYGPFNKVRTEFFNEYGVFDGLVPASTGIGMRNPAGAAVISDLFAVKPKTNQVTIREVVSPLQCPAIDYKSSFSRAVEILYPDYKRVLISGTAGINPDGTTAHLGDTAAQIDLTMQVIEEILKSCDMTWDDTTRAIAYFKDMRDLPLYYAYCKVHNLPRFPLALSHADICRDDLLFEIELDALRNRQTDV